MGSRASSEVSGVNRPRGIRVPFSKGKLLLPMQVNADSVVFTHFSPLLEGEITTAAFPILRSVECMKFQSPSRRGNYYCASIFIPIEIQVLNFSPLLEGEITTALRQQPVARGCGGHFSPLLEGEITTAVSPRRIAPGALPFQSPSRRGNYYCDLIAAIGIVFRDFSPLLEGEITTAINFTD